MKRLTPTKFSIEEPEITSDVFSYLFLITRAPFPLEKIYLFLTPSKTDGRVPSQQGAPTTCNLTYSAHRAEFSQWRGEGVYRKLGAAKDENHPLSGSTDILRNRSIGCPCSCPFTLYFGAVGLFYDMICCTFCMVSCPIS